MKTKRHFDISMATLHILARPGGKFCVSVFRQSQECVREALALRAGPLPCQNPTASCLVCAP